MLVEGFKTTPTIGDQPREHGTDDLMSGAELLGVSPWQPQVRLAKLLEPHLQVVQAMADRKLRRNERLVNIQVRHCLKTEGFG
ncbi:MAG TPA: hypothetical protein VGI10_29960 [Polyangiaceae bacterium]